MIKTGFFALATMLGVIFFCSGLAAQPSSSQSMADDLFAHSQWEKAAQAYSKITAEGPGNGPAWQNLGECLLQLRKYNEAIQSFSHALVLKFRPLLNQVNIARVYAQEGDRTRALKALQEVAASGEGGRIRPYVASSTEFQRFADDAAYKQLLAAMAPCASPEYRQFDFWVGNWVVQDPAGKVVGQNAVTREQDGCLIIEHWKDASGMETGSSFNYYDIRDKKWHQLYIDNSGNAGAFPALAGEFKDHKMVLVTDEKDNPVFRWTWYTLEPGRVRQMAEKSTDGQKTWHTIWDSVYVSKKAD